VLVVEGEDSTRELYAAEMAASGFMVLEASDGATGIEKAVRFRPHAVVLDLVLPGIDGFKVARRLRGAEGTQDCAIIAVTALTSERSAAMALAAGCDSFFSKPVSTAALVGELVRLLARRNERLSAPDLTRLVKGR
jgi:DNA-binding response OmpR family regulator